MGPYRIEGLLGRGGMGEVHRAYDTTHDRVVALKLLSEPFSTDEAFRARFAASRRPSRGCGNPHVWPRSRARSTPPTRTALVHRDVKPSNVLVTSGLVDVYALAYVFFECLTGHPPVPGGGCGRAPDRAAAAAFAGAAGLAGGAGRRGGAGDHLRRDAGQNDPDGRPVDDR